VFAAGPAEAAADGEAAFWVPADDATVAGPPLAPVGEATAAGPPVELPTAAPVEAAT
jgi:hypothetical protein